LRQNAPSTIRRRATSDKKIKISERMARLKMVIGDKAKPIEGERSEPAVSLQAAGGVAVQLAPSCSRR
jgi:hypothetical protein